jgi:hypothetical protein
VLLAILALVAAACDRGEATHGEQKAETMHPKPMAQLVEDIRRADTTPSTGEATSFPIPVRAGGGVQIAVFRYQSGYDAKKRETFVAPPVLVLFFDPVTGALLRQEPRQPGPTLGSESFDVPRTEVHALLAELYGAYDALLPAFAQGDAKPGPGIQAAARKYKEAFARVSGKLLMPAYTEIGRAWFQWIDAAAAS